MAADFGRVETCGCCGKDVKKPVFSKRLNMHLGKDCSDAIVATRLDLRLQGEERAAEIARKYYPRSWQRLMELAR